MCLKGKTVGVQTTGGSSYFWFLYLLDKEGIDVKDIKVQNMSAGDAGAAFVAGKVDAAVTWEPWLTNAEKTDFGHVMTKSDETPGVIVDTLAMSSEYVKNNPKIVQGITDAWFDAIEFWKENPDEGNKIMAKPMGQTIDEFEESLKGVRFYDHEMNKEYFGSKDNPGKLFELTKKGIDSWSEAKIIDKKPDADKLVDPSFVQ